MAQIARPELQQTGDAVNRRGISVERFFTRSGIDPLSEIDWELRSAIIAGEDGRVVFEQRDVEVQREGSN